MMNQEKFVLPKLSLERSIQVTIYNALRSAANSDIFEIMGEDYIKGYKDAIALAKELFEDDLKSSAHSVGDWVKFSERKPEKQGVYLCTDRGELPTDQNEPVMAKWFCIGGKCEFHVEGYNEYNSYTIIPDYWAEIIMPK